MKPLFGNLRVKTERYRKFWSRESVQRPLVGFTQIGWFPLNEFAAAKCWAGCEYITPETIDPAQLVPDHVRMVAEGDLIEDDLIRGIGPMSVALPFLPAMLGSRLRLLADNVLGVEQNLSWDEALAVRLDSEGPWYLKYMELVGALVSAAEGRFPVSHGAEIGPTDIHAVLRGHTQSIIDSVEEPERTQRLLARAGGWLAELTEAVWNRLPRFEGGWFDGQYCLWAPGPIARLQEDASAVYSPALYRRLVKPVDRVLSRRFECAFMHLHSTSMFLLDEFLAIEELNCFEINHDVSGPPLADMIPCFRQVQAARRSLVVRGAFSPDELRQLTDALDARGLFLLIMIRDFAEIDELKRILGMS